MTTDQILGIVAVISVLALAAIGYAVYKKVKSTNDKKKGYKSVSKILKRTALLHQYKTLDGLSLPLNGSRVPIDHIFIGFFGILVVCSKKHGGEIYAVPGQKEWTQVSVGKKNSFYNPIMQNNDQIQSLRNALNDLKMYKIPIEGLVVFTGKNLTINIPKGHAVLPISELRKYIDREKFYVDKGVDIEKVYEKLRTYQLAQDHLPS